jgi:hypothetical protein
MFPPQYGVKQFVARVQRSDGQRFNVFTTGDDKFYLFDPIDRDGCSFCMAFPIARKRLRNDIRHALAHGVGNVDEAKWARGQQEWTRAGGVRVRRLSGRTRGARMTRREFNRVINACRNRAKTRLVREKLEALPIETRRTLVQYLLRHNGPVLKCLLCADLRREFEPLFGAYGYWHQTGDFIHSDENFVRYPMRHEGRVF